MTRDYSQFLPSAGKSPDRTSQRTRLAALGWQPFFARQISVDDVTNTPPVRVTEVHRSGLHVQGEDIDTQIPPGPEATVGDWLLYDNKNPKDSVILDRKSLFKRRAPGTDRKLQLIAANMETAFVVTSCNADFNVARLERYLALAFEAEVTPVILLTKTDLCEAPTDYIQAASDISDRVAVRALDATGPDVHLALQDWCKPGQTVTFIGSSGVGKSTLTNALLGGNGIATAAIREDDAKGRHTTTHRQLHLAPGGFAVLDTPGMRELQLTDAESGIADVFDDIAQLAASCRFKDCAHQSEPGCAVKDAVTRGDIAAERLERWYKLAAEDRFNSATLAERRSNERAFGRMVKSAIKAKKR